MLPIIQIGPLSLPTSPLLLLFGFWLGSTLAERAAPRFNNDPKILERILWTGLAAGLIGARLSYLLRFPGAFRGQWLSLFSLNASFLDPLSGILLGLSATLFIILRHGRDFWNLIDNLTIFVSAIIIFVFLARFAAGSGAGIPTTQPWGISLWGTSRHPVQLYFALFALAGLLLTESPRISLNYKPGCLTALFISYSASYLLFFSRFQEPGPGLSFGFRQDQIMYWFIILAGLILFQILDKSPSREETHAPNQ